MPVEQELSLREPLEPLPREELAHLQQRVLLQPELALQRSTELQSHIHRPGIRWKRSHSYCSPKPYRRLKLDRTTNHSCCHR